MSMMLIGYDVEVQKDTGETKRFLEQAYKVHTETNTPCTMFICGKTLELNLEHFKKLMDNPLFDLCQHTYSHVLLKTVVMDTGEGVEYVKGGSIEQIREEIVKTQKLFQKLLGIDCKGFTGPYGYYRGLQDRPDILEILDEVGIEFVRTDARNENDYFPVPHRKQPYWYDVQGYGDILEFPITGWQEIYIKDQIGFGNIDGYVKRIQTTLDCIHQNNYIYSYAQHDWSSIMEDSEMIATRRIIEYAQSKGIRLDSYKNVYGILKKKRYKSTHFLKT